MRRLFLLCSLLPFIIACTTLSNSGTLSQQKENLYCLEYSNGVLWEQVQSAFGDPAFSPKPEPGTNLSQNARGYKNLRVYFYTKSQKIEEEGKTRFKEVVYKVEICREK